MAAYQCNIGYLKMDFVIIRTNKAGSIDSISTFIRMRKLVRMATKLKTPKKTKNKRVRRVVVQGGIGRTLAKKISRRGRRVGRRRALNNLARLANVRIYDYALAYLENNRSIPELDSFLKLQEGDLIRSKEEIIAQETKPAKRGSYSDYRYLKKITHKVPKGTMFMFLERHNKFPEYYRFAPIGFMPVWVNIADNLLSFNMYKRKNRSKNDKKRCTIEKDG